MKVYYGRSMKPPRALEIYFLYLGEHIIEESYYFGYWSEPPFYDTAILRVVKSNSHYLICPSSWVLV